MWMERIKVRQRIRGKAEQTRKRGRAMIEDRMMDCTDSLVGCGCDVAVSEA
jgi:hypothetical protein